ncbi:MAG TPA: hypothetical protein VK168_16285 [Saprospiraceae bacterium]|nr:hypothetical protein [Saprospiraceae bacterium]
MSVALLTRVLDFTASKIVVYDIKECKSNKPDIVQPHRWLYSVEGNPEYCY